MRFVVDIPFDCMATVEVDADTAEEALSKARAGLSVSKMCRDYDLVEYAPDEDDEADVTLPGREVSTDDLDLNWGRARVSRVYGDWGVDE